MSTTFRIKRINLIIFIFVHMYSDLVFSQSGNTINLEYEILEDSGQYTFVGRVAEDSKIKDLVPSNEDVNQLKFDLLTNAQNQRGIGFFTIGQSDGVLRTNSTIDRDIQCPKKIACSLSVKIAVISQMPTSYFTAFINVIIKIIDQNDNPPTFSPSTIVLSVPENTALLSTIGINAANDTDSPQYGISHYTLISNVPEWSLKQVNTSGVADNIALYLKVEQTLDRETKDFYRLVITAFDKGGQTGTLTVEINILDSNDHQPIFTQQQYVTDIDESHAIGSQVASVTALDKDISINAEIIYSFDDKTNSNFGQIFFINNKTGHINLTTELDYERTKVYNLVVKAKELYHDSIPVEAQVIINVNDVNDNAPIITTSSLSGTAVVDENAPVGTFIALLEVTDPDTGRGGSFSCTLDDNPNSQFRLDSINTQRTEFTISTNFIFDREEVSEHVLQFKCKDDGAPQLASTSEIKVSILDKNDNPPVFSQQIYTVEILENNENGVFLTQVKAFDPDSGANGEVVYSLSNEAMAYINVDPKSGNILAREVFDYERYKSLQFAIIAMDKGEKFHQKTAVLNIKILNENDEPPQFTTSHFHLRVNESEPRLTLAGQLAIHDRQPYNNVTYTHKPSSKLQKLFSIEPKTGLIYTKQSFDADDSSSSVVEFEVEVRDVERDDLSDSAIVTVLVIDQNDNRPQLSFPNAINNTVSIGANFERGQVIMTVSATDRDSGRNSDIMYMIEAGNEGQYFTLGENAGELRTMRLMDHISERVFVLTITATDRGYPPLTDRKTLFIVVNSSLSVTRTSVSSNLAGKDNLTIVIVVAVISAILIIALIIAIVLLQRKDKFQFRQKQKRLSKLLYDQKPVAVRTENASNLNEINKSVCFNSSAVDGKAAYYANEINTEDECPAYRVEYPLDQKVSKGSQDDELDSELSDHSGADSGRGSNDDADLNTSHLSLPQSTVLPRPTFPSSRRDMLLYGAGSSSGAVKPRQQSQPGRPPHYTHSARTSSTALRGPQYKHSYHPPHTNITTLNVNTSKNNKPPYMNSNFSRDSNKVAVSTSSINFPTGNLHQKMTNTKSNRRSAEVFIPVHGDEEHGVLAASASYI